MKTTTIAEIGINHNGDINIAKKLIYNCKRMGVDYVKFQTFKTSNLLSKYSVFTEYQKKNLKKNNIYNFLKINEFNQDEFKIIFDYCRKIKIKFFSTAFDLESLNFLHSEGQKIFKIPSGEIDNTPLIDKISSFKCPVIVSTGMTDVLDLNYCLRILNKKISPENITIMHCTSSYPTPLEEVNLNRIKLLKQKYKKYKIGFSDHSAGIEMSIAGVVIGTEIIEKHITLNKEMEGPDHKASLNIQEYSNLIKGIKQIEVAMGDHALNITPQSKKNLKQSRKSIYAKEKIFKGEKFTNNNLITLRPAIGISPKKWHSIIGRRSKFNFEKGDLIKI